MSNHLENLADAVARFVERDEGVTSHVEQHKNGSVTHTLTGKMTGDRIAVHVYTGTNTYEEIYGEQ